MAKQAPYVIGAITMIFRVRDLKACPGLCEVSLFPEVSINSEQCRSGSAFVASAFLIEDLLVWTLGQLQNDDLIPFGKDTKILL